MRSLLSVLVPVPLSASMLAVCCCSSSVLLLVDAMTATHEDQGSVYYVLSQLAVPRQSGAAVVRLPTALRNCCGTQRARVAPG